MDKKRLGTILLAAVMVAAVGAAIALAEEVEIEADVSKKVKIKTDSTVEILTLDDLEDGEERVIESEEHTITIRRDGDEIKVEMDGEDLDERIHRAGKGHHKMIFIEEGGDEDVKKIITELEADGAHAWHTEDGKQIKIVKVGGEGEHKIIHTHGDHDFGNMIIEIDEECEGGEERTIDVFVKKLGGERKVIMLGDDEIVGGDVKFLTAGGDGNLVTYRCEETGSTLIVKKEHASEDSFKDPATGCDMKRSEDLPKKIVIKKRIEIEEEE